MYKKRKAKEMKDILSKLAVGASTSSAFSIDMTDVKKMLVNALLVGASAMVLYVSQGLSSLDLGTMTPYVVPIIAGALDLVHRYLKDNSPKE